MRQRLVNIVSSAFIVGPLLAAMALTGAPTWALIGCGGIVWFLSVNAESWRRKTYVVTKRDVGSATSTRRR